MTLNPPGGVTRPAPAAKAVPPELPPDVRRLNDRFRMPKARTAMILFVPIKDAKETKVTVLELKAGVRLELDVGADGIGTRHVDLSLSEINWLTDALNRMRRKVAERPEHKP